jgi:hypothetical protein
MQQQKISMSVGYDGEKINFHFRMISLGEEQRYIQRFVDIVDTDFDTKSEKEYQVLVDAVANWSVEPIEVNGVKSEALPAESVREYFSERTDAKERILNTAYMSFKSKLTPSLSFL